MSDPTKCEYCSDYVTSQNDIHECGQCAVHLCTKCMDGQDLCHECIQEEEDFNNNKEIE